MVGGGGCRPGCWLRAEAVGWSSYFVLEKAPCCQRSAGSRPAAGAESQQAASRAHRREPEASRQPPTIAVGGGAPFQVLRGTAQRRVWTRLPRSLLL